METKAGSSVREAMGSNSCAESINNTNRIAMRYNKRSKKLEKEKDS
ncbi:MAG: hypothetical protein M3114_02715 [Thermoproteota archaeon]|nr:hypothetical protein [Thermoproteota archaeon]